MYIFYVMFSQLVTGFFLSFENCKEKKITICIFETMQRNNVKFLTLCGRQFIPKRLISSHPLFHHQQLAHNVWRIEEKYFDSWNLANMYFFKGSEKDLLVDTGVGIHNLPSFLVWSKLRENRDKPLIIALTHTHFDHSGGVHLFAKVSKHLLSLLMCNSLESEECNIRLACLYIWTFKSLTWYLL